MLIWKVIAANPGITRDQIWERVEHDIPAGYAMRMYARYQARKGRFLADASARNLASARGFILTKQLAAMRQGDHGPVSCEGTGNDRRYTVVRELKYQGNIDAIDETGTKAAEHMALADALRRIERVLATSSAAHKYGRKNCEAMALMVKALRAKDRAVS